MTTAEWIRFVTAVELMCLAGWISDSKLKNYIALGLAMTAGVLLGIDYPGRQ